MPRARGSRTPRWQPPSGAFRLCCKELEDYRAGRYAPNLLTPPVAPTD